MKLEIETVRVNGTLRSVSELHAPDTLVMHWEQSLVAASWAALHPSAAGPAVVLGRRGIGTLLATDVSIDDAWTVDPSSQQVLVVRLGKFSFLNPAPGHPPREVAAPGLPGSSFGIALDREARRALVLIVRDVNLDFSEYSVVAADLATGKLIPQPAIHANATLELLWDDTTQAWVVGNTNTGSMWRWDGTGAAARFDGPPRVSVTRASFTAGTDGVTVTALLDGPAGGSSAVIGRPGPERVVWSDPIPLPGGSAIVARRHPSHPIWACLAYEGAGQQIQIRDLGGKIEAAAPVHSPVLLNQLQWSAASPDRVWGWGLRALAAATISQSAAPRPRDPNANILK